VSAPVRDKWADWLLERRHGGDGEALEATMQALAPVRDRVLENAALRDRDVVLDVGCGDGLIAFGALDRVGESGRVILSDVSNDLLERCRALAGEAGVADRCEFVQARAQDLAAIGDESVDAVTTRSVVIYVPLEEKPRAFCEFFRVLKPGGRLSMFEPINRFGFPEPNDRFMGFDVAPILRLAGKVKAVFERARGERTLIDFDERDLLTFAERAGFAEVRLSYEAKVERAGGLCWGDTPPWDVFLHSSGNPCAPTLAEALEEGLTPAEREEFVGYLRPRYEAREGTVRFATSYLLAVKR
jgi:ubiquinone/menaquinone biosynthesis C-methylase UbiE